MKALTVGREDETDGEDVKVADGLRLQAEGEEDGDARRRSVSVASQGISRASQSACTRNASEQALRTLRDAR